MRTTFVFLAAAAALAACSDDFAPANQLSGIRLLATRSDASYARPGETVMLEALAIDARSTRLEPMQISYVPTPCINPEADDPTTCFPALVSAYPARVNLDAELAAGEVFAVALPGDIIATAPPARSGPPRGLAFVFVMACGGHVERLEPDPQYPTRPPFGCFDRDGNQLGKDDFVFGYARIYAYEELRNANPAIEALTYEGAVIGPEGFEIERCTASDSDDCPKTYLDAQVLAASQEPDPVATTSTRAYDEQVWISYFVTGGKMEDDLSVLYDSLTGKVDDSDNAITAASPAGDYTLYAILRDNRGGVSWTSVPFTIYEPRNQ